MIGRVGRVEQRLASGMRFPVEIAAIDDHAADRGAVPADIFGGRVNDDRGAVFERPAQERGCRIVHDQRNAEWAPDVGDFFNGEHFKFWIRQSLGVISARFIVDGAAEVFRVGWIDEANFEP